ncbi:DUF1007 family protein [uncultured Enterovirga sp.]|uniref:DUF1007 family protein n=1 Tax=uncultured Enterovirga sp. TaxID=2026352 RepID=UPI0035CA6E31
MTFLRICALVGAFLTAAPLPAAAHPHVWIVARATIQYDASGLMTGIRHRWTFDEGYSAYAVQGLETGADGKPKRESLDSLARTNVTSLADQAYFTSAKANGAKMAFGEPANPLLEVESGRLVLHFDLPLKAPAKAAKALVLQVYDPTFFVDFAMAGDADAVTLAGAPTGCVLNVTRPKPAAQQELQSMSETFFNALTAANNVGASVSPRVLVACP